MHVMFIVKNRRTEKGDAFQEMERKGQHYCKVTSNSISLLTSYNCQSLAINKVAFISASQMRKLFVNFTTLSRCGRWHGLGFCSFHRAVKKSCCQVQPSIAASLVFNFPAISVPCSRVMFSDSSSIFQTTKQSTCCTWLSAKPKL